MLRKDEHKLLQNGSEGDAKHIGLFVAGPAVFMMKETLLMGMWLGGNNYGRLTTLSLILD